MNNDEYIKKLIEEKDKITLRYKQKINNVKQHYGVEFDVEHFKNNEVKNITFINMKYKNLFINGTIIYDNSSGKFDYIDYELLETRNFKNLNHKRLIQNIDKEYKLKLVVAEVERLNNEYVRELNEIEEVIKNAPKLSNNLENTKVYEKDEETE